MSEVLELRISLTKAKERTDAEYELRLQTESNVEALKRCLTRHPVCVFVCGVVLRLSLSPYHKY